MALEFIKRYPTDTHQVTHRYYIGAISFLNEDFEKVRTTFEYTSLFFDNSHPQAEQELTLAFYNCHVDAQANRQ